MGGRIANKAAIGLLFGSLLLALAACVVSGGSNGEIATGATVTFVFIDGYTGQPVSGVVVVIGGQAKVSGADGRLESGVETGGLLEGYFDPATLAALGYWLYATGDWLPNCFSFAVPAAFEKTFLLAPISPPAPQATISGTAYQKGGGRPVAISSGLVQVYNSAGFLLASTSIASGAYSVGLPLGTFTFIVYDDTTTIYYYAVVPVTGSATVDLSYTATDLVFSGNAGDATAVHGALKVGETLIELASASLQLGFSIAVPHLGQDVIRLISEKQPDAWYRTFLSQDLTQDQSGLSLEFAAGSTVPQPWTANLAWDSGTRTLSWSPAGNAVYAVGFAVGRSWIMALAQGASFTVPAAFDVSSFSSVTVVPVWADGPLADLVPEALAGSTVIWYNDRAAVLGGGGGK